MAAVSPDGGVDRGIEAVATRPPPSKGRDNAERGLQLPAGLAGRWRAAEKPFWQLGQRPCLKPGDVHLGDTQPLGDVLLSEVAVKAHDEDPLLAAGQLVSVQVSELS
jgi:hypothetical protein